MIIKPPDYSLQRLAALNSSNFIILHQAAIPIALLALVIFIQPRRSFLRNIIFFPIITSLYLNLILNYTSRHWGVSFCVGAYGVFGILQAFNFLIVHDLENDEKFRWYGLSAKDARENGLWKRAQWTSSLMFGSRGVGWAFKPKGHAIPPTPPPDRLAHITRSLGVIAYTYVVLDVYSWLMTVDPLYQTEKCWYPFTFRLEEGCYPPSIPYPMNYVYGLARKFFTAHAVYAILTNLFLVASVILNTLCITDPQAWPALYGDIKYASTLRGFWGYYWHQAFRCHFAWPGIYISELLRLDPKSGLSTTIKVYTAFILSGALHSVSSYTQARNGRYVICFFMIQPIGMAIESVLPKPTRRVWTILWLLTTCQLFFPDYLEAGIGNTEAVPFSFWRWWKGEPGWRWGGLYDNMAWDKSAFGWGIRL